jgi:hypothetical protein
MTEASCGPIEHAKSRFNPVYERVQVIERCLRPQPQSTVAMEKNGIAARTRCIEPARYSQSQGCGA